MADYLTFEFTSDTVLLQDDAIEFLESQVDGWEANPANLETWIIEAVARMATEVAVDASEVPLEIFRYFGTDIMQLPPVAGSPAVGSTTWISLDTLGHTIEAGTLVGIGGSVFEVVTTITIPAGSSSTAAGEVEIACVDVGSDANDLSGPVDLIDTISWVSEVILVGTTTDGVDEETDEEYLNRLVTEVRLMAPRPIIPQDFADMTERFPEVARATAVDLYVPALNEKQSIIATGGTAGTFTLTYSGQTTGNIAYNATAGTVSTALIALSNIGPSDVNVTGGPLPETAVVVEFQGALAATPLAQMTVVDSITNGNANVTTLQNGQAQVLNAERTVAVAAVDEDGEAVSTSTKADIDALLQSLREVNFIVSVIDPNYVSLSITGVTVTAFPGWDHDTVEANIIAAVTDTFTFAKWGSNIVPGANWTNTQTLRYLDVAQVIKLAPGVAFLNSLSVEGGGVDIDLGEGAPLLELVVSAGDVNVV